MSALVNARCLSKQAQRSRFRLFSGCSRWLINQSGKPRKHSKVLRPTISSHKKERNSHAILSKHPLPKTSDTPVGAFARMRSPKAPLPPAPLAHPPPRSDGILPSRPRPTTNNPRTTNREQRTETTQTTPIASPHPHQSLQKHLNHKTPNKIDHSNPGAAPQR
jgi:hypothetical protein